MKALRNIHLSNWKVALIIAFCVFIYGISEKGWNKTYINGDGKGYYAYLPALFIYHDLSFGFIEHYEKKHYQPGQLSDFRQSVPGGVVNRYYAGTALLQAPFFLTTLILCHLTGQDADGYSYIFQLTILLAGCFYLFTGLWCVLAFLREFFSTRTSVIVSIFLVTATPLLFYTIYNPDFSHIYSFAAISLFLRNALLFFKLPEKKMLMLLFLVLGIIILIRPVNGLILFALPFIAQDWERFKNGLLFTFTHISVMFAGIAIMLAILSVQLFIYYFQCGHLWVYSYGEAGFNFLHPHFADILFSYRKGLFLYTPLLLMAVFGFIPLFRESLYKAFCLLGFLILLTYVLSAWDYWTYGMTYGQRPFIEYYLLFAFLLGCLINVSPGNHVRVPIIVLLSITVPHNLLQLSQHRHYILHWDDMNREKYWKVFLRTDPIYYGYLWGPPIPVNDPVPADTSNLFSLHFNENPNLQLPDKNQTDSIAQGLRLKPGAFYQVNIIPIRGLNNDSTGLVISLQVFPEMDVLKNNFLQIGVYRNQNQLAFTKKITLRNLEAHHWNKVQMVVKLPKPKTRETIKITILNQGKYFFYYRNIRVDQLLSK